MQRRILAQLVWVVLVGCGGSSPPATKEPEQPAASAGAEAAAEAAPDETGEQAEPPAPSGPATLTVVTKVAGKAVAAQVKVLDDASGALLAEGKSGQALAVHAGELTVEATLSDSKALRGHETVHRSVSVAAGANATETVIFERCMVRVAVRIRGKLDPTSVVTLIKDDEAVAKLTSGDQDYVAVVPARYSVKVRSKRAEIVSSDITCNEGATQTVPIDVD